MDNSPIWFTGHLKRADYLEVVSGGQYVVMNQWSPDYQAIIFLCVPKESAMQHTNDHTKADDLLVCDVLILCFVNSTVLVLNV